MDKRLKEEFSKSLDLIKNKNNRYVIIIEGLVNLVQELQEEMEANQKMQDVSDVIQNRLENFVYDNIGHHKFQELCVSIEEDIEKVFGRPFGYEEQADYIFMEREDEKE